MRIKFKKKIRKSSNTQNRIRSNYFSYLQSTVLFNKHTEMIYIYHETKYFEIHFRCNCN